MRDEFSFRSLKFKSDISEEKIENSIDSKRNSIVNPNKNNPNNSKLSSIKENAIIKIKEYFEKNKQLTKNEFGDFITFIGLNEIWPEEDQNHLWEIIIKKAKDKNNIDYDAVFQGISETFEDEEEDDLIDIKDEDIDYNNNDSLLNNDYLNNNENNIEEYLNSIKDNIKLIFGIKFINDIFLKKHIKNNSSKTLIKDIKNINTNKINEHDIENEMNINLNKNNSNLEEEIDVTQLDNKLNKKIFVNMNDLLHEIKTKYRFIMVTDEELDNYFNNLVKSNGYVLRKSITSCYIIIKTEKSKEYCIDKELLISVNSSLLNKLKDIVKKLEDNQENDNIIPQEKIDNDKIIEELKKFDNASLDMFQLIMDNNAEKELKNLIKIFNFNYVVRLKNNLYTQLEEIINENKNNSIKKIDETETQLKIDQVNNSNNQSNLMLEPDNENNYLKQQISNLKESIEYLKNENEELKMKLSKDNKEITLKNSKIKINKLNIPKNNNFFQSSAINSKNYISCRDEKHFRNNTLGEGNNIFNLLNLKNNGNLEHCHTNRNPLNNLNLNKLNRNNNSNPNLLNDTYNGKTSYTGNKTNSFMDYNGEEFTNSKIDLFSINENKNIKEGFFLDTTGLGKEPNTPTLTPRSAMFDNKDDDFCLGDEHNVRIGSKISEIYSNSNRDHYYNCSNNDSNFTKKIEFNKKKKMSFGLNTEINNNESSCINYDFIYLSVNKKIVKLLLHNNDDLKSYEIFSDKIHYILNGGKKKKGLLLITSQCFYILEDNTEMNCIERISHKLLLSISINKNSFNHLLISFTDGSFIIIEIFCRIHLLNYLKELYFQYDYNKININICNSFYIKLKNNFKYEYELKNRKDCFFTPNFENAQKIGVLMKHQENIFRGYFVEKTVVLTSIGLIVFEINDFNKPQMIIPIVGSGIKTFPSKDNKNLYCFKIKTINNEKFIFASYISKEINDWMTEFTIYINRYESRMNNIISDFVVTQSKK